MRRLLLLSLLVACSSAAPSRTVPAPPPTGIAVVLDAGVPDAALVALADAGPPAPPPPPYRVDASDYHVDAHVAGTGKTYLVVSEDEYATKVGRDVLAAGGNAVDSAVATAFALAVTRPSAGNVGGGGFAVVRTGKNKVSALDFRETAPMAATPDMYKTAEESLVGAKASGTPGSVAGLWALHKKWGTKPWKDLVAPAIALAKNGYQVGPILAASIKRRKPFGLPGAFGERFAPGGVPLEVGATVKNPELAIVLERIAAKGPDGFYKGDTAKAIATAMKANGGLITEKDLAGYKVVWRTPISFTYRGKKFSTMPPPSSGGIVLAMTANMLRNQDLAKLGWHSVAHIHWLAEIWRRAYAARNEVLGDPAFVKNMPVAKLISQAEADRLVKTVTDRATPSKDVPALIEGTHTTHFSVVDKKGMAVAITTTLNTSFGSGFMIEGILMNNEMDDFAARPGQPNVFGLVQGLANKVEPGKRMLSSMSPTVVEDEKGELYMVVGAQGGPRIITSVWQSLSNVIDFGLPADAAVAAPRMHHQHLPDDVVFDDQAVTKDTADALQSLGYELVWRKPERIAASASLIVKTPTGWAGAADPRGGGAAMGD
jgi:gamma-glutamyltranspeptidase/glutathione hydrolase